MGSFPQSGAMGRGGDGQPQSPSTTSPASPDQNQASPGGQSNPVLRSALGQLTAMAQTARQYAQAYPQCADEMRQVGQLLQKCLMKTTQAQPQGESPVPPV